MQAPKAIRLAVAIFAIALTVTLIYLAYSYEEERRLSHSFSDGANIIAALEAYRVETKTYPDNLERLVPKQLKTISHPSWGTHEWLYNPLSRDNYELVVLRYRNYYEGYYYNSKNKKWNYHS